MPGRTYTYQVHYEGFQFLSIAFSVLPSQVYPGAKHKAWGVSPRKKAPTNDLSPEGATADRRRSLTHLLDPTSSLSTRAGSAAAPPGLLAVGGPHKLAPLRGCSTTPSPGTLTEPCTRPFAVLTRIRKSPRILCKLRPCPRSARWRPRVWWAGAGFKHRLDRHRHLHACHNKP